MKEKIKIAHFIKSIADMTLETSAVINSEGGLKKKIEEAGQFKLEGASGTEFLIAEIFVCQIPLNKFLNSKNKLDLLGLYFSELYYLLQDKYKYFKSNEELILFETLIQQRFPGYYKAIDNSNDSFISLGGEVAKNLSSKTQMSPLLPILLGAIFGEKMINLNDFIKKVSEKFEIEINL